ncbi:MAG: hypothetical protein ACXABY_10815 [Candidatus Thorarchaeota archaeon]|jgi:hypothetical protein
MAEVLQESCWGVLYKDVLASESAIEFCNTLEEARDLYIKYEEARPVLIFIPRLTTEDFCAD